MSVAALYIDPKARYPKLGVDCWDVARDARRYDGPHPVVAHPPCKHWSRLRHMAIIARCRYCKKGFRANQVAEIRSGYHAENECGPVLPESDADCAPRAVEQVRRWGGVLEHPAGSKLWEHCGLPEPDLVWPGLPCARISTVSDEHGGYSIEVCQVGWGHCCQKPTWLYLVGVPRSALEAPPFPGREPTHYCGGGRTSSSRKGGAIPPGIKAASSQQKRRTPPLFAEYLIRLANAASAAAKTTTTKTTEAA